MFGAVIGDIVGSRFEFEYFKKKDFPLFTSLNTFTDDTVLTVAIADALLNFRPGQNLEKTFRDYMQNYVRRYGDRGYGINFYIWAKRRLNEPYQSMGNGSAMRVSACAYFANSLTQAKQLAFRSANVTHNHPEGIKGAVATATAIYLARIGATKQEIRNTMKRDFYNCDYMNSFTLDRIRPYYEFDDTCPGSVPQAIEAFLEGDDFEDVLRNAISVGGDSDTIAAIAGSIAEPYFGIPTDILQTAKQYLPEEMIVILEKVQV